MAGQSAKLQRRFPCHSLGPLSRDVIFCRPVDVQTTVRCGALLHTHELVGLNLPPLLLCYSAIFLVVALLMSPYLLGTKSVER